MTMEDTAPSEVVGDVEWTHALLPEQARAAAGRGFATLLLGGPGTGKTWTLRARAVALAADQGVDPSTIVALTLTRAAADDFRQQVNVALAGKATTLPVVTTVHAFILTTLLRNAARFSELPQPVRVADHWEERNILVEDLCAATYSDTAGVQREFSRMAAAWGDGHAAAGGDPSFAVAWEKHRRTYGYVPRPELAYRLKRALEERADIEIAPPVAHLLVDDYQDLSRCELEIVRALVARGAELFAAADERQSIYRFRRTGRDVRQRFAAEYPAAAELTLEASLRCAAAVAEVAASVAGGGATGPTPVTAASGEGSVGGVGDVGLLRFPDGEGEVRGVARLCRTFIENDEIPADEILLLVRSDRRGVLSKQLAQAMAEIGVPFSATVGEESVFDGKLGRSILSLIRLAVDPRDALAWRTLLQLRPNKLGPAFFARVHDGAHAEGLTFIDALARIPDEGSALSPARSDRVRSELTAIRGLCTAVGEVLGDPSDAIAPEILLRRIHSIAGLVSDDPTEIAALLQHVRLMLDEDAPTSVAGLLQAVTIHGIVPEQERRAGAVNLLTMDRAKGLSARAVVVLACEDATIPGTHEAAETESAERRLLYVALSRAREKLFITYAERRNGAHRFAGKDGGSRELSRYLRGTGLIPLDGDTFVSHATQPQRPPFGVAAGASVRQMRGERPEVVDSNRGPTWDLQRNSLNRRKEGWAMSLFGGGARRAASGYSVIGDRLTVRGEIDTDATVRVDGRIEGTVHRAGTLIVGARGGVVGNVEAGDVVIAGTVQGDIRATGRIEIEAGAAVHGEIRANSMVLHDGAAVHGQVAVGAAPPATGDLAASRRLELAQTASAGRNRR